MRRFPWKIREVLLLLNRGTGSAKLAKVPGQSAVGKKFTELTKSTVFNLVGEVEVKFDTHHTQGLLKIGEYYYLSSVEVTEARRRLEQPDEDGFDRGPGRGIGHLFKIDTNGNLIKDLVLINGGLYHPSGIDFDGTHIWIGLAAYRPYGETKIYKVDVDRMEAEELFSVQDHIGSLVCDRDANLLYGLNWGSRKIYCWTPEGSEQYRYDNPSHYVDFQDARYVGANKMIASGMNKLDFGTGGLEDIREFGGMALIDLPTGKIVHEVPIMVYQHGEKVLTHNPMDVELNGGHLNFYFAPEDNKTIIHIYQPSS